MLQVIQQVTLREKPTTRYVNVLWGCIGCRYVQVVHGLFYKGIYFNPLSIPVVHSAFYDMQRTATSLRISSSIGHNVVNLS